eukprot:TRINITY_DN18572_c0_g1_i2.p1 TRINITY_DN18572_c0_g1~~TRINITY_DN18572_c0_g1_i2.p1  ORF type:complete len:390 (+),score=82.42 TRINITY_DN18572_c0_g1_i2:98-1267(+)
MCIRDRCIEELSASRLRGGKNACVLIVDRLLDVRSAVVHTETLSESLLRLSQQVLRSSGMEPFVTAQSAGITQQRAREGLHGLRKQVLDIVTSEGIPFDFLAKKGGRSALAQLQSVMGALKADPRGGGAYDKFHETMWLAVQACGGLSTQEAQEQASTLGAQKLLLLEMIQDGSEGRAAHMAQLLGLTSKHADGALSLDQALRLLLVAYSVPGDPGNADDELVLMGAIVAALMAEAPEEDRHEQEKQAGEILERCKSVLELQSLAAEELQLAPDAGGILAQLLSRLLVHGEEPPTCMQPAQQAQGKRAMLRGMLGIPQRQRRFSATDHHVMVCFVVGGVTHAEVAEAEAVLEPLRLAGIEMPEVIFGSTSIEAPDELARLILQSKRSYS